MEKKYQAHSFEAIFLPSIERDGIAEDRETNLAWEIYQKIRSDGNSEVWIPSPHLKVVIQRVRMDDGSLIISGHFLHQAHMGSATVHRKTHQEWIAYLDRHAKVIEQELMDFMTQMTEGIIKEHTILDVIVLYYSDDGGDC